MLRDLCKHETYCGRSAGDDVVTTRGNALPGDVDYKVAQQ